MSSCKINKKKSNHNDHIWFNTQYTFADNCGTTIFLTPTISPIVLCQYKVVQIPKLNSEAEI